MKKINFYWRILICVPFWFAQNIKAQPVFTEVAGISGVNHTHYKPSIANGVSFMDFDGDGDDDLTFASELGQPIDFYTNINGSFEKIEPLVDNTEATTQILWIDIDNDGDKDLFVGAKEGITRLYENTGGVTLVDITESAGLLFEARTVFGATWGDYDRDGYLDLYFGDHNSKDPTTFENRLFRNNWDNSFSEISYSSSSVDPGIFMWCSSFLDYNNDMWPDIYTANDYLTNQNTTNTLLQNNGDCTFGDVSGATNSDLSMHSMGIGIGDYDNDGWQDLYLTNTSQGNALLHHLGTNPMSGKIEYKDVALQTGTIFNNMSWGSSFFDADNDGFLDLYVSSSKPGVSNMFCINDGNGSFVTLDDSFDSDTLSSYSNAIGDFNNDGFPDVVIQNNAPYNAQLWSNGGNQNNWIKVGLTGVKSNRDAIGAKIEIYFDGLYQMRYIHSAIGFLGQNSNSEIFGMKLIENIDSMKVSWPTGHIDTFYEIPVNQKITIIEGESTAGEIFIDPSIGINCSSFLDPPRDVDTPIDPEEPEEPPIDIILGIKETEGEYISVSPNPFKNLLVIKTDGERVSKLIISDLSGHIVKKIKVSESLLTIDLSMLANQVYILEATGQKIQPISIRIVKQ